MHRINDVVVRDGKLVLSDLPFAEGQHVQVLVAEVRAATDSKGWPPGYFEQTAGSFANEPLEAPDDPPPTANPRW